MKKPHIVIIMADHLRADFIGPYTPNISKLQEQSVSFEHAYCASPLCVPARGSFFTGKYPNVTGSINNAKVKEEHENGYVRKEHTTLYELLEEDWDSWHTGKHDLYTEHRLGHRSEEKTHWFPLEPRYKQYLEQAGKRAPGGPDFRTYVPESVLGVTRRAPCSKPQVGRYEEGFEHFVDGFITRETMDALRNRNPEKPLLLNAMYFAPHPPFDIPDPWYSRFQDVSMADNVGRWGKGQSPLQMYNLPGIVGGGYERQDWQRVWDVYTGYVSLFDDCVGQIVEELKRQGIYDDTLLMVTSDHGEMLGSHRMFQKMCMYEESVRTPFFLKFPHGAQAGTRIAEAVSAVDVLPTLCDYLGIQHGQAMSGLSLMPLIRGEKLEREAVFIQYDGNGSRGNLQRCVVSGRTKLIVDVFKDETFVELYHLDQDPQEMHNAAFDEGEEARVAELLRLLHAHMARTGDKLELGDFDFAACKRDYAPFV